MRVDLGGEQVPERAWLDLFAQITTHPATTLPCERVARLLCATFGATACSYAYVVEGAVVGGMVWWDGVSESRRTRAAGAVADLAMAAWDGPCPASARSSRLSLPAPGAPPAGLAFIVGRNLPFCLADQRLATTLWTLLKAHYPRCRTEAPSPLPPAASRLLTARESAVLALLCDGLTAAAIARRLQISVRTVHKHLERIYAKLEVTDRLAAVLAARRLGVVSLRPVSNERLRA